MSNAEIITKALERSIRTVTRKPSAGQGTGNMRIDMAPDGCCTAIDGDASMVIDMSQMWGGQGTTPSPGFYLRAALGACLAQSYHIYAATHGVMFDEISVEIEDEYDMRGVLGIDKSISPGYVAVRYAVNIRSSASEEKIREVIDYADALDSIRDIFAPGGSNGARGEHHPPRRNSMISAEGVPRTRCAERHGTLAHRLIRAASSLVGTRT